MSVGGTSRFTTCATRADTALGIGVGEGQTSVNIADVRLILFYTHRKKCRIPRISNDGLRVFFIGIEEMSPFMHQHLHRRSYYSRSDWSLDSWSRMCALHCTPQKPSHINNHGGFGTRPPTDARTRTHLTRSGDTGRHDDILNVVAHADDRRRRMRGRFGRNDVAQAIHHIRDCKLGSIVSTILGPSSEHSDVARTHRTPWVHAV